MAERPLPPTSQTQTSSTGALPKTFSTNASPKSKVAQSSSSRNRTRPSRSRRDPGQTLRSISPVWVDIDKTEPPRVRSRRSDGLRGTTSSAGTGSSASVRGSAAPERTTIDKELGGFFPKLSRILEGKEYGQERRTADDTSSPRERSSRRTYAENNASYRRPVRQRRGSLQRGIEALANPSLISVLSSLTSASGTSSGSNSTVTQKSYERSLIHKRRRPRSRHKNAEVDLDERESMPRSVTNRTANAAPNVFGFTESPSSSAIKRTMSTSSSGYAASDGGSSLTAATTGFKSPFASPVLTHRPGQQESWVHQDKFSSDSGISVRGSSPESHNRNQGSVKQPSVRDEEDSDDDEDDENHSRAIEKVPQNIVPTSAAHSATVTADDKHVQRLREQEQELRQHVLQQPYPQRYHQPYGTVPYGPSLSMPFQGQENQYGIRPEYGYPPPHAPQVPPNGAPHLFAAQHSPLQNYPAPDPARRTIAGYELVASKLSKYPSEDPDTDNIKPMYRRFERLNHRILLHLQDEICELEEQLRSLDECIAQMAPIDKDGHVQPASRRAEAQFGGPWHSQRRDLLGMIFLKLDQYNQALSSYSNATKSVERAHVDDIQAYQAWMKQHTPIDKTEARFLEHEHDLIAVVDDQYSGGSSTSRSTALCLPLLCVLPLAAFAVITGFLRRVFVLLVVGVAETAVVCSTDLGRLISVREWTGCAIAYFVVMTVLAAMVR